MPQAISRLTDRAWAELFRDCLGVGKIKEPSGEGWLTCAQIAKKWGKSGGRTAGLLKVAIAQGRAEKFKGFERKASGKAGKQVWYRPIAAPRRP
jgi:hypothetical protein